MKIEQSHEEILRRIEADTLSPAIYGLLYRLGATANYTGFFYVVHSVRLAIEAPARLRLVTKLIYPKVAEHYGTSWRNVERNIRTVISIVWRTNPALLSVLAGHRLTKKPDPSRFLSILTVHIQRGQAGGW